MNEHDAELVERVLRKEEAAVVELIDRLTPIFQSEAAIALYRRGRRQGRDIRQEMADLVQALFLALWEHQQSALRRWQPQGGRTFDRYFRRFARFHVSAALRTRKSDPYDQMPYEEHKLESLFHADVQVAHMIEQGQMIEQVLILLNTHLTSDQRWLARALFIEERSIDWICAQTGISRGTIYQRKRRLLIELRELWHKLHREDT